MEKTEQQLKVNGVTLHYEHAGEGPALLLVHGNGESLRIFDEAVPLLSRDFSVYAIDLRGHGGSSPVSAYHYAEMASDLAAFIETLHLVRPFYYGFSDGGIVGLLLAIEHPGLLGAFMGSGVNIHPKGLQWSSRLRYRATYLLTHDPKLRMMLEEPDIPLDALGKLTLPVLFTAGSRDMIRSAHTQRMVASVPGARFLLLAGCGHGDYVVHAPGLAPLIRSFFLGGA